MTGHPPPPSPGSVPAPAAAPTAPPAAGAEALPKVLGVLDGVVLSLSNISPTFSIGVGLGIIGASVGVGIPAAFLLGLLPILGIALAYTQLNRREANCGTAYVWVGRAVGPMPGYLIGWVTVVTQVLFLSYAIPLMGQYALLAVDATGLHRVAGVHLADAPVLATMTAGLVLAAGLTALAILGIEVAARFQLVLIVLEFVVLLAVCLWAVVAGDAAPFDPAWFSPTVFSSPSVMAMGILLAVFMYWGWETAFSVTEENADARTSARAGMWSLAAVAGLFLFASVAFQRALTPEELVSNGERGLPYLGELAAGPFGRAVTTVVLLCSIVACVQSVLIGSARQTLAMSRDGVLGAGWAALHPRRRTPHLSTLRIAALAAALALLSAGLGSLQDIIVGAVTSVGILISLYYAFAALACAITFAPEARRDPRMLLVTVLVPVVCGLALLGLGCYMVFSLWTSSEHFAFAADNGRFLTLVPVVILVGGVPAALWAKYGRRAAYFDRDRRTP
ncbi:APC family permease [Streptomyces sp. ISL-36]|uniref:APC family permease n=1 Tax=Streptomyces sp. ISL-36 TaxID=2819182 RepID=UPI001BE7224B|nr:APC family permease [Streptomyces sp. ISL-36]MBT2444108.1 APC family permease [Streptomyces sp. ISL-36]